MPIRNRFAELQDEITGWRRDFHSHPELMFDVHRTANRVAEHLNAAGIESAAIHGNKSQTARQNALKNFKSGALRVLVATDIAARGIDIDRISHVVNFELPNEPESYVHRIGRTARAGKSGSAVSFCDASERGYLHDPEADWHED